MRRLLVVLPVLGENPGVGDLVPHGAEAILMRRLLAALPVIREGPGVGDLVQHGFEHPVAHSVLVQVRPDTLARPGVRL